METKEMPPVAIYKIPESVKYLVVNRGARPDLGQFMQALDEQQAILVSIRESEVLVIMGGEGYVLPECMDETRRLKSKVKVFRMNSREWWIGRDLDAVKAAHAKAAGYGSVEEAERKGLFESPYALSADELEKQEVYYTDDGTGHSAHRCTFREQVEIMMQTDLSLPMRFAHY